MKRVGLLTAIAAFSLMAFTVKDVVASSGDNHSANYGTTKDIIHVSPNPTTNGTVTINNKDAEEVHVYVFDEEGTMLHQVYLKGNGKQVVSDLKKGALTYEVFKNDISIKQGKIVSK